ncbi:hypothetical protein ZWY2020_041424 [Hordeum vulgare]|nr:hypothetical protein ZWY2020_041424 [Hordeum vulgare]
MLQVAKGEWQYYKLVGGDDATTTDAYRRQQVLRDGAHDEEEASWDKKGNSRAIALHADLTNRKESPSPSGTRTRRSIPGDTYAYACLPKSKPARTPLYRAYKGSHHVCVHLHVRNLLHDSAAIDGDGDQHGDQHGDDARDGGPRRRLRRLRHHVRQQHQQQQQQHPPRAASSCRSLDVDVLDGPGDEDGAPHGGPRRRLRRRLRQPPRPATQYCAVDRAPLPYDDDNDDGDGGRRPRAGQGEEACVVRVRFPDGRVACRSFGAGRPVAALFRYCRSVLLGAGGPGRRAFRIVKLAGGSSEEVRAGSASFRDLGLHHCTLHVVLA